MKVNRTQFLVLATVFFLVFAVVYHIWANWGLITIHAKNQPLSKIIASMERQGHANIQTDMASNTSVTMDCVKVPLTDALETLSTVTDSRWRLLFFAAADKATLKQGELSWFGGQRPTGWRMVSFPMGGMLGFTDDPDAAPLDPRDDVWTPQTAAPAPVQAFFKEAASLTNAGFAFPEAWNPTVKSRPSAGKVTRSIPKLISAAGGHEDQIFFLSMNGRGGGGPRGGGDNGGGATMADFQPDLTLLATRTQNEINRLPPDQRSQAQSDFDAQKAFWDSIKNMSEDDRRAAIQKRMQDPDVQQAMSDRQDAREGRMNHDQRMQHFSNYVDRKMSITGKP